VLKVGYLGIDGVLFGYVFTCTLNLMRGSPFVLCHVLSFGPRSMTMVSQICGQTQIHPFQRRIDREGGGIGVIVAARG